MAIFDRKPTDWSGLQILVGQLFAELGCGVEIGKKLPLVRGAKEIDVWVKDSETSPASEYLCECKYWSRPVTQETVHSFRTIVADYGAHRGIIVSKSGFQSGAIEASKNTTIDLMTFESLQDTFYKRWRRSMPKRYMAYADALFPYWDPSGGRRPPLNWNDEDRRNLQLLVEAYHPFCLIGPWMENTNFAVRLPMALPVLNDRLEVVGETKIETYRQFYDFMEGNKEDALCRYKALFRENA